MTTTETLFKSPDDDGISKTKVGAILVGASVIVGAIGKYLLGEHDVYATLQICIPAIGAILFALGLRDAL